MIFRTTDEKRSARVRGRGSLFAIAAGLGLGAVLIMQPTALGQQDKFGQAGDPSEAADAQNTKGPLAGPEVGSEHAAPGVPMGFTEAGTRQAMDVRANLRIYRRALGAIELSDEQKARLREIVQRYEAETRAYMEAHAEELRELRAAIRKHRINPEAKRRRLQATEGMDEQEKRVEAEDAERVRRRNIRERVTDEAATDRKPNPELDRAQQRLREINRGRSSVDPYLMEVWEALTPEQQKQFEAELEEIYEALRARRGAAGDEMMSIDELRKELGEVENDRRREMIRELLEKDDSELTPRERRILERIRQRRTDIPVDGRRGRRGVVDPPGMDEVEIEEPTDEGGHGGTDQ